jgi:hypothetical protein
VTGCQIKFASYFSPGINFYRSWRCLQTGMADYLEIEDVLAVVSFFTGWDPPDVEPVLLLPDDGVLTGAGVTITGVAGAAVGCGMTVTGVIAGTVAGVEVGVAVGWGVTITVVTAVFVAGVLVG